MPVLMPRCRSRDNSNKQIHSSAKNSTLLIMNVSITVYSPYVINVISKSLEFKCKSKTFGATLKKKSKGGLTWNDLYDTIV